MSFEPRQTLFAGLELGSGCYAPMEFRPVHRFLSLCAEAGVHTEDLILIPEGQWRGGLDFRGDS